METPFTRAAGVEVPLICGPMYPCSNPELVAAVSDAGGLGVVQPIALTYVHGHEFREGLRLIRSLTSKPIGMNALIEQSSDRYRVQMEKWIEIALEEGIRFFITSLGNPRWVVERVAAVGGVVYHDVTEPKWAEKALAGGVHGLIAVNRRAGGHAGGRDAVTLLRELTPFGVPVVAAGGVGEADEFRAMLDLGYAAVQCGTRFIATTECRTSDAYKAAILKAGEDDIVLSERITGVPVAIIRTPLVERMGLRAGPIARWMLRGRRTRHWMRTIYALRSLWQLKRSSLDAHGKVEYWQAGRSVARITAIEPAGGVVRRFAAALGPQTGGDSSPNPIPQ
ncbi:MAG: nitronate monooxygenase [Gemmatimonadetes bacterium]|nr:nitronate monooxygenase [Gemmatimonadota bacterium]MBK9548616.1 nitronate monooxygenase [Gemmatimonadota bacterium]